MKSSQIAAGLGLAAALAFADAAAAACDPTNRAEMPVTLKSGKALVPARINGSDVQLIVDSGATWNGLSTASGQALGLDEKNAQVVSSASLSGQAVQVRLAHAKSLALAGREFGPSDFLIGGAFADVGAAGRLGGNVLAAAPAVEYDLAGGVIRIFADQGCRPEQLASWAADAHAWSARIEPMESRRPQIRAEAQVNGVPVRVVLDTAASFSNLSRDAAAKVGVDLSPEAAPAIAQSRDVRSATLMTVVRARLRAFGFGPESQSDVPIRVIDMKLPGMDMILGLDFLLQHRVLVDRAARRLYVLPVGSKLLQDP